MRNAIKEIYYEHMNVNYTFLRANSIIIVDPANTSFISLSKLILCLHLPQLDEATVAAVTPVLSKAGAALNTVFGGQ